MESLKINRDIRVPTRLRAPHRLIIQTRDGLQKSYKDQYGKIYPRGSDVLDVRVSPLSTSRALRILNTLVKEAERLGFSFATARGRFPESYIVIRGEKVQFGLTEKMRREKRQTKGQRRSWLDPEWEYLPTDLLQLELKNEYTYGGRKRWRDTKRQKLENMIGAFLSGAFDAALAAKEQRRKWAEERKRREETERLRREQERLRREEEKRRQDLVSQANRWKQSQTLLAYLSEVERRASLLDLTAAQWQDYEAWLSWAYEHAARLDPLNGRLPFETRGAANGSCQRTDDASGERLMGRGGVEGHEPAFERSLAQPINAQKKWD